MFTLPDILALAVAALLGGLLGLERQLNQKPAGLRTMMLIALGACLFTLLSRKLATNPHEDGTRIAAQIIAGIGFLGAGAIIRDRGGVQGLTTAATIWLTAALGMACGGGFYLIASVTTLIALIVLFGLSRLENKLQSGNDLPKKDDTSDI